MMSYLGREGIWECKSVLFLGFLFGACKERFRTSPSPHEFVVIILPILAMQLGMIAMDLLRICYFLPKRKTDFRSRATYALGDFEAVIEAISSGKSKPIPERPDPSSLEPEGVCLECSDIF